MLLYMTFAEPICGYGKEARALPAKWIKEYMPEEVSITFQENKIDETFFRFLDESKAAWDRTGAKEIPVFGEIRTRGETMTETAALEMRRRNIAVCLMVDGFFSTDETVRAARILERAGTDFYIGLEVTLRTAWQAEEQLEFFKDKGWKRYAFWPGLCRNGKEDSLFLTEEAYKTFLCKAFSFWARQQNAGKEIHIREFENMAQVIRGEEPFASALAGYCPFQNLIFPDGIVLRRGCQKGKKERYPKQQRRDGYQKEEAAPKCRSCRWAGLCRGGRLCSLSRTFCNVYREFYEEALPELFNLQRRRGRCASLP